MTAIFVGYLAISYTFSGFFCYLAFLKNSKKQVEPKELQSQQMPLKSFALTLLWPVWMIRESLRDKSRLDDRIYLLEPQNLCPEAWFEFAPQTDSSWQNIPKHPLESISSTPQRIKIEIPQNYQEEPVISRLTSEYGLTFNITEAILEKSNIGNGLVALELYGTPQQIQSALDYLWHLNVKILEINCS
ncbi:NIL domain-containing protein [Aerosakkonema funiforme]|uniref:NIL domain-containing protein n=1 Tax=Aerosakkonema funiforme TaxID=1246630 RepID=UPI0035B927B9